MELPKKTGKEIPTKNDIVRKILKTNFTDEQMYKDFVEAYSEAEAYPEAEDIKKPEIIKIAPEIPDLKTLETTILRYYEPSAKKNTLFKQVDFDISKGKVLSTEQNDKFFKMKINQ